MSVVRFISDTHFYHKNMAIKRGFSCEEEMNEFIVSQWNKVVSKKDVTWILGDITMEKSNYEILNRLNGIKKVVLGNHDEPQHIPELLKYVNSVCGMFKYKHKELGQVFLTHCPIHPSELDYKVNYNIHGHVHEKSIKKEVLTVTNIGEWYENVLDNRYVNVSCEVVDYQPKLLTELIL